MNQRYRNQIWVDGCILLFILGITAVFLSSIRVSSQGGGTSYYLDPNATGSGTGLSWANAFPSIAACNSAAGTIAKGGNILYISGGTTGQVYTIGLQGELHLSTSSTTIGNQFMISAGRDSGHNGVVIFDGQNIATNLISLGHSTYLTGDDGTGKTNFILKNSVMGTNSSQRGEDGGLAINQGAATNATLELLEIFTVQNGIYINCSPNYPNNEIRRCYLHDIWGDHAIKSIAGTGATNWGSTSIHDCTIQCNADRLGFRTGVPSAGGLGGPDGVVGLGSITISNCILRSSNGPVTPGQHPDTFQFPSSWFLAVNCYMANWQNSGLENGPVTPTWVNIVVYNCLIGCDEATTSVSNNLVNYHGVEPGSVQNPLNATNAPIIVNNDFFGSPGFAFNGAGPFTYQVSVGNLIHNNALKDMGVATVPLGIGYVGAIRGSFLTAPCDYNAIDIGTVGAINLEYLNDSSVATNFFQMHGQAGTIGFALYSYRNPANDYHLTAGDVVCRGNGTNLTALFASMGLPSTDRDGVARPSVGNWDIGAYQYVSSGGPPAPINGQSNVGGKHSMGGRITK